MGWPKRCWGTGSRAALLSLVLACSGDSGGEAGDPCLTTFDCSDDLICFETRSRGPECMVPCLETDRLCMDGSVCLAGPSGQRVCYVGGDVSVGEACANSGDCELGAVCIASDMTECQLACDTRAPSCLEGQSCIPLMEPAGYCGASTSE